MIHQKLTKFPSKIIIKEIKTDISEATKKDISTLALWSDGSKVESGRAGTAVV